MVLDSTKETHKTSYSDEIIEYPDGRVYRGDKLIAEEPNEEQKSWFVHKMKGSARMWETAIRHRPWIVRWNYIITEDSTA